MLPFDKKKTPTTVNLGDLTTEAKGRCMQRFIEAIKQGDIKAGLDAFDDLMSLCDSD